MALHLHQQNQGHTPPHHQLPNPISHLQPQPHSQLTPFSTPPLKDYKTTHQPTTRQQAFKKWLKTLPPATQTQVTNIQQILRDERITKEQLQEAATRYGIPLTRVLKLPPRSLQQLVAAGSALAACLAQQALRHPTHLTSHFTILDHTSHSTFTLCPLHTLH